MGIQVTFYTADRSAGGARHRRRRRCRRRFSWPGLARASRFPRLFATVLGDVPPAQAGVAAGITNSALQIGAAVSVAAIGSLFFMVLDGATGERAYAHAFSVAQWTATAGLFLAMLITLPPLARRRRSDHPAITTGSILAA